MKLWTVALPGTPWFGVYRAESEPRAVQLFRDTVTFEDQIPVVTEITAEGPEEEISLEGL